MAARTVKVAHSPDPDDAYMACALHRGHLDDERMRFEVKVLDVETLNKAAPQQVFDVTALSLAAVPAVAQHYAVLDHGASFGDGYGPVVVARPGVAESAARRGTIAIPGARTTAALALRLAWSDVKVVEAPFAEIPRMVKDGKVTAGVLIHEGQITYEREGLAKMLDLGAWWKDETNLPLPLGVLAVRRSLGDDLAEVSKRIRRALLWAQVSRADAMKFAAEYGRGLPLKEVERFVDLYVTDLTMDMGPTGRSAVAELLKRGADAGHLARAEVAFVA